MLYYHSNIDDNLGVLLNGGPTISFSDYIAELTLHVQCRHSIEYIYVFVIFSKLNKFTTVSAPLSHSLLPHKYHRYSNRYSNLNWDIYDTI